MNSRWRHLARLSRFAPSRRQVLEAALVTGLAGAVSSIAPAAPRRESPQDLAPFLPRIREMRATLHQRVRPWALAVNEGGIARKEGKPDDHHTYTVDIGQLMWHFAMMSDSEPYTALRDFAARYLIVDIKEDPFTKGFVLWRQNPEQKPDASGTTEALRIARALWAGAHAFNRPQDAELALTVLDGYARHQTVDKGVWMICNYFNFGTRGFATNSFIIDYDADFLREVAEAHREKDAERHRKLTELADKSYEVMRGAVAPCGLLYDLLQPELKTMYFDPDDKLRVWYFSPNDVVQTNNASTTAATVAKGAPEVAEGVLAFLLSRAAKIYIHYYGRSGERVQDRGIGAPEYAAIARLAALAGNKSATATFVERALSYWETIVSRPQDYGAWIASELLLGFHAILDLKA